MSKEVLMYENGVIDIMKHVSTVDRVLLVETHDDTGISNSITKYIKSSSYLNNKITEIYVINHPDFLNDSKFKPTNQNSIATENNKIPKVYDFKREMFDPLNLVQAIDRDFEPTQLRSTYTPRNILFMIYDFDYYVQTGGFAFIQALKNFISRYRDIFITTGDTKRPVDDIRTLVFFSNSGRIPTELTDLMFKIKIDYPNTKEIEHLIKVFVISQIKQKLSVEKLTEKETDIDVLWNKFKELKNPTIEQRAHKLINGISQELVFKIADFSNLQDDEYFNSVTNQLKGLSIYQINKILKLSIKEGNFSNNKMYTTEQQIGKIDVGFIAKKKIEINKVMIDELNADLTLDQIGGMGSIKRELPIIKTKLNNIGKHYGIQTYKGMLLVGVPGTGKTTVAKMIANGLNLPLLRLDVARLFGGVVGQSEKNIQIVLDKLNAMAPNVVLVDEIEKAFSGTASSNMSDGGTMSRVFMTFLYWMQEHKSDVIIIATANNIEQLPPELTRAGRFDSIFFVDLPTLNERIELINIFKQNYPLIKFDFDVTKVASQLDGYSGAELFNLIDRCATIVVFNKISENPIQTVTHQMMISESKYITKIAELKRDEIQHIRQWADKSGARKASDDSSNTTTFIIGNN